MKPRLSRLFAGLLIGLFCILSQRASATHIYGMDFYYTWITGTTYRITLAVYGDCGGTSFPTLSGAQPEVTINNGNTLLNTIYLTQQGGGVEVTPVCANQAANTICNVPNSPIPGVKRYIYTSNVTLGASSANWKFRFTGAMTTSQAGRSNSITNVVTGTITAMEATLNNTAAVGGYNNSPVYTTIPTPFFCINKPANYNPGAVDQDNDSLTFALVPGLVSTPIGGTVSYNPGYLPTAPLATAPSTFAFTTTNGQLSFTPNIGQQSLVVGRVNEYRNGVLVGTSMREMTFVVLTNCNNNPPGGDVSAPSSGSTQLNSTTVRICKSQGTLTFTVAGTDLDGDVINMTSAGLPTGATFTVTGNNTSSPTGQFFWNLTNVAPGTYTFFITYTDNGCPLSSKQTLAYTVIISPDPVITFNLISAATCTAKAVFTLTPTVNPPWNVTIKQGTTVIHTFPGLTGQQTDSLPPGTYTITSVNSTNCTKDTNIVIAPPALPSATVTMVTPTCFGGSNGSFTVSGYNGIAPYTYALGAGAYGSSGSFTGLSAGTYVLHIRAANACLKDTNIVMSNPPDIYSTVSLTKPPCNHFQNGSMTVTAYNSVSPYQYALGSGAYGSSGTFTNLFSGPYTVHIKNDLGCIKDTVIVLPDSVKIQATLPLTNILCNGGNNGSVTINANGAYPPYTYSQGSGPFGNTNTFTGLTAGIYTFHVKDIEGCYFDTTVTITQPTVVTAAAAVTANVTCPGASTGSVTVTGGGGVTPYTYSIDGGAYGSSASFSNLTAGSHSFSVRDANNCTATATANLTQPPAIVVGWTTVMPLCNGGSNGSITLSGSGGTPGYTYAIDATAYGASTVFGGLAAGSHTLHVKDANGCIKDSVVTLNQPTAVGVTAAVTKPVCNTLANGKVILTGSGGTPGYTYAQGSGPYGASATFTPLAAGTYIFHVKDANGCVKDTAMTLVDSTVITSSSVVSNVLCFGGSTGSITITGAGGRTAYTYAIGSNAYGSSNVFGGLAQGSYTLHVKDANGCIKDTSIAITQPTYLAVSVSKTDLLCNGATNGSLSISASGGTSPYQYALGSGTYGSSGSFTGLGAGSYVLHARDTNGCIHDTTVTLIQPAKLAFTLAVTNVLCNGGSTGTVTVNASGGTPAYSYAYDANAFGSSNALTGFNVGSHTIHLKDANNCTKDTTITITQPTVLGIGGSFVQPLCYNTATGVVTVTGNGGTTPYTFALDASAYGASGTFNGVAAGTHTMKVKDANGCLKDSSITIGEPTAVTVTAGVKRPRCSPLVNGTVTLYPGGGTSGYTFAVGSSTYGASAVFNNLGSGTYIFHVKDSKGCIKDTTITVTDSVFLSETLAITNANCWGVANGSVEVTASGGDIPFSYALGTNPYSTTNPIISVGAGTYVLHTKDANGCIKDTTITVTQPARIVPTAALTQPLCYGNSNGVITIGASGGVPNYAYSQGSAPYVVSGNYNGLAAGTYTFHVKDINNCIRDTTVTLAQPTPLRVDSVRLTHVFCYGGSNGTATLYASGATPAYTYTADANPYAVSNLVTGLNAGVHTLHVKDANACIKDTNVTITQPTELHFGPVSITTATCEGKADGQVVLSGTGGSPWVRGYDYSPDNVVYKDRTFYAGLTEGVYTFYIRDSNGCVKDTSVIVPGYPHINLSGIDVKGPSCFGMKDGVITMNSTGGVPPLTYQLIKPAETNYTGIFDTLAKGIYTLHVQDGKGCFKDTTVTMTEPDSVDVRVTVTGNDCIGANDGGIVKATGYGGTQPYGFVWSTTPATTGETVRGLPNGPVSVLMTDANGCTDTANALVTYDNCCTPYIPNAFTPNGDGKNDVFRIMYKGDISKLEMGIYNRFGQRVYIAYSIDGAWDGTFHGVPQDLGTYYYRIKFICGNGGNKEVEFKGDITLIR